MSIYEVSTAPAGGGTCSLPAGTRLTAEYTDPGAMQTGGQATTGPINSLAHPIRDTSLP